MIRYRKTMVVIAAVAAGWFLLVSKIWLIGNCSDCGVTFDRIELRLAEQPIWTETTEHLSSTSTPETNAQCHHENVMWRIKNRWRGDVFPTMRSRRGTERLSP